MLNLGKLLQEAGVQGARPQPSFLRGKMTSVGNVNPSKVALERLPEQFGVLKKLDNGKEFVCDLLRILEELQRERKAGIVSKYTVIGLTQLAHELRDGLSGHKRSSFEKFAIPRLLSAKERVNKGKTTGVCEMLISELSVEQAGRGHIRQVADAMQDADTTRPDAWSFDADSYFDM